MHLLQLWYKRIPYSKHMHVLEPYVHAHVIGSAHVTCPTGDSIDTLHACKKVRPHPCCPLPLSPSLLCNCGRSAKDFRHVLFSIEGKSETHELHILKTALAIKANRKLSNSASL